MAVAEDIIGNKFGPLSQITILQRLPKGNKKSNVLRYLVSCSICKKDPELFGDGLFETDISNLKAGKMPCGCSKIPKWTEQQTKVRLKRKASEHENISFIDFAEPYIGNKTRLILSCTKHGEWHTAYTANFLHRGRGCPNCRIDTAKKSKTKSDEEIISSFFIGYPANTIFTRSDRTSFWKVYCPVCDTTTESYSGSLQIGHRSCLCARKEQKFGYINTIKDGDIIIAIKFGITGKSSKERCYEQNRRSVFQVDNLLTWEFNAGEDAKSAERVLKNTMDCGVISKELFPDGYSETTYIHNIDNIISVYEEYGGKSL